MRVDAEGKVKLFLVDQEKWQHRWAVDARELLKAGAASLAGPVVQVKKGKATRMICEEQVTAMSEDGWKRVASPPSEKAPAKPSAPVEPHPPVADPPKVVDFTPFKVDQLGLWLASATGMSAAEIAPMTKPQLIEQLERVNFVPPTD